MFSGSSKAVQVKISASVLTTELDSQDPYGKEKTDIHKLSSDLYMRVTA